MRMTNGMVNRQFLSDLEMNHKSMIEYQRQVSTGMKFERPSDSPFAATKSLDIRKNMRILEQKRTNLNDAKSHMVETETAVTQIGDVLKNIKELVIQGSNGTNTKSERQNINSELKQNKEHIINILNTNYAGRNLFGGHNTKEKVITESAGEFKYNQLDIKTMTALQTTQKNSEKLSYSISNSVEIDVSYTALEITKTGDDNLLNTINKIIDEFSNEDINQNNVDSLMKNIDKHTDNNLKLLADIGGKTNRIEMVEAQLETTKFNLGKLQAEVEGVDQEEVIIKYKTAELVYNAALAIGSRIIQPTLLDYLS